MTTSNFMADFAASDRRSAHAHLRGTNLRVHLFNAFVVGETLLGRRAHAAQDFEHLSLVAYRNIPRLRRFKQGLGRVMLPAFGLAVGAALAVDLIR